MAYVYLLDLHDFIDQRLEQARKSLKDVENAKAESSFHAGRIEALSEFKSFLTIQFNPRLPRRIRESFGSDHAKTHP